MIRKLALTIVLLGFCQKVFPDEPVWNPVNLPTSIATKQEIINPPVGWLFSQDFVPCQLTRLTVYDGVPAAKVSLVPTETGDIDAVKSVALWSNPASTDEGVWISVSYSCSSIELSRQLPKGVTTVKVVYDKRIKIDGFNQIISVEYR